MGRLTMAEKCGYCGEDIALNQIGEYYKKENAIRTAKIAKALNFLNGSGETGWIIDHARKALEELKNG